jgi:Stress responsive A/B Barrel Domain
VTGRSITRIDEVTLRPGARAAFERRLRSDYVPAAEALGLELVRIDVAPPGDGPGQPSQVRVTWGLADVDAFWEARARSMANPALVAFWNDTAGLVATRARRYAGPASEVALGADAPARPLPMVPAHTIVLLRGGGAVGAPALGVADRTWFGVHLPGSVANADASWEVDAARPLTADDVHGVEGDVVDLVVLGAVLGGGVRAPRLGACIKRTLLLTVTDAAPDSAVAAFEADLLSMPRHIDAIRNWRLSRIDSTTHRWTHAWEQEYESLAGLRDAYMRNPFHWAVVDGWFDPEDPRCIVEPGFHHLFYETDRSILSPP